MKVWAEEDEGSEFAQKLLDQFVPADVWTSRFEIPGFTSLFTRSERNSWFRMHEQTNLNQLLNDTLYYDYYSIV